MQQWYALQQARVLAELGDLEGVRVLLGLPPRERAECDGRIVQEVVACRQHIAGFDDTDK